MVNSISPSSYGVHPQVQSGASSSSQRPAQAGASSVRATQPGTGTDIVQGRGDADEGAEPHRAGLIISFGTG